MLRMLMAWCVPTRVLRFQSALTDRSPDERTLHDGSGFGARVADRVAPGETAPVAPQRA
jgi:hypothetical protein